MGRTLNTRLSRAVRGQIVDRMRRLAAESGIAVVTVPARDTSRHCPRCLVPLRHRKAPDRPTSWKWAVCPNPECGWQGDRDTGAWLGVPPLEEHRRPRPGPPGQIATDRATGTMAIRSVADKLEATALVTPATKTSRADRSETAPTQRRTTRPAPRRRRALPRSSGDPHHGPRTAAPRSPPAPGRADDQHTHPPTPAARSSTGRRIPPPRPCLPTRKTIPETQAHSGSLS
ncbi:zinc ribbon domain-containing protein [Streptomyces sp. NPDC006355]|uniref:zinc ribbon domain-containing protein n=1 Tax=Streptomyces sp. NPDC006355 TaxID=3156758 RepID=UPI0033AF0BF8